MGRLQSGGAQRAALVIPQGSGPPSRTGSGGGGGCAGGGGGGVSCRNVRAADASIVLCGASSSSATKEKNGASASARGIDAARRAFRVNAALRHHRRCILSAAPSGRARIAPAEGARSTLALAPAVPLLGRLTLRGKDVTQIHGPMRRVNADATMLTRIVRLSHRRTTRNLAPLPRHSCARAACGLSRRMQ